MIEHKPTLKNPFPYRSRDKKVSLTPDYLVTSFGGTVDLNHPSTYKRCKWKNHTIMQLYDDVEIAIGRAIMYMKYYTDQPHHYKNQLIRIEAYAFAYSLFTREMRFSDSPLVRMYLMKFLYKLEEETENLC